MKKLNSFEELRKLKYKRMGDIILVPHEPYEIGIVVYISVTENYCSELLFYKNKKGDIHYNDKDDYEYDINKIFNLEDFYEEHPNIIIDNILIMKELKETQFTERWKWENLYIIYDNWMKRIPELKTFIQSSKFGL